MNRLFSLIALAWVSVLMTVQAADLQTADLTRSLGHGSTRYVGTDGSIALRLKWVGTQGAGASVDVGADGNLIFTIDGTIADVTVSADGTIDVSTTPENTWGEVAAVINVSANWQAILVDVLPSWSSDNVLTDVAEVATGLENEEGLSFKYNTADTGFGSISIGPEYTIDDDVIVDRDSLLNRRSNPLVSQINRKWTNELYYLRCNATVTTGPTTLAIYAVKDDTPNAEELLLWSKVGEATTVDSTVDFCGLDQRGDSQLPFLLRAPIGYRMVAKYTDTTTSMSVCKIQAHGLSIRQ